ncbi:tyrosine-type recombinase/integrase [Paracoccus methylarcula]|uniref:Integrase n=1 Tax=Paracoccus methylarcula TaxID=72022 RepID=A0A422QVV5_9RHOB|nr:tyrosine-type recombinase/integrase [Paracoccus methylarcula]RNF34085.1 integrase [Paracoccus methylarcula]
MKRDLPAYVYRKGQKGYLYFCRWKTTQRMYEQPGTAEFAAEYALLMRGRPPAPKRTIKGLIQKYVSDPGWLELAYNTRKSYGRHFKYLEDVAGNIDPATLRTAHIYEMRDALRDTPTDANRKIGVLSTLLNYGRRIGWVERNVAEKIEKLKGKKPEREPWPTDKIKAFRKAAAPLPRLIFEMLLGTGQRIGDVLKMRWSDIEDGGIWVRQQKTGHGIFVPLTDALAGAIDKTTRDGDTIIAQPNGKPVSYSFAHKLVMDVRVKIGAEAWDIHSLRHSAAAEIASLPGMTIEHVMAITGHTSEQMARHYSRRADMRSKAREAQRARRTPDERKEKIETTSETSD